MFVLVKTTYTTNYDDGDDYEHKEVVLVCKEKQLIVDKVLNMFEGYGDSDEHDLIYFGAMWDVYDKYNCLCSVSIEEVVELVVQESEVL